MKDREFYRKRQDALMEQNPFMSNTEVAYQMILQDILSGTLQPEERIPQDELAELFKMSRTPVRDAMLRLEKENYIIKSPKGGYMVHRVTFQEFYEFCDFRILIESHAAYLAANTMTEEERGELTRVTNELNAACDKQDKKTVFAKDEIFHELIVRGAHNRFLLDAFLKYQYQKRFYFTIKAMQQDNILRMRAKHNAIHKAIMDFDAAAAERLMRDHLSLASNFF